jgi:iron(III) transport system substrate-binding protein
MRRAVGVLALLLSAAALLPGCGERDLDPARLVVYSAGPRDLAEALVAEFERHHPVSVELFVATTGQIMAKLEAERFNPRADVVILASGLAADTLRDAGRLRRHEPPAEAAAAWADPGAFHHAPGAAAVGIALRRSAFTDPEKVAAIEWEDLLGGPLSARAMIPSPSRSGSSGDFVLAYALSRGEEAWSEFARARLLGLEVTGANAQAITNLRIGSHDALVAAVDYLILREIARGEPLLLHFPRSGVPVVPRPAAILASTRRPETAEAFVDFLFTTPAQAAIAERLLIPADRSVELPPVRRDLGEIRELPLDREEALRRQRAILRRFQYEVERAARR